MASTDMRVATIDTLWMVLIFRAGSSVSSSSLKSSKGLKFYIRSNLILLSNYLNLDRKV